MVIVVIIVLFFDLLDGLDSCSDVGDDNLY